MNERIRDLQIQAFADCKAFEGDKIKTDEVFERFAELIVRQCIDQVEQAKNSPFVSLDDAKRMSHFVDVTKKRIEKHFGVRE